MNLWADLKLFSNVIYGPNLCLPHKTHRTIIFQLKYTFLQGNKKTMQFMLFNIYC